MIANRTYGFRVGEAEGLVRPLGDALGLPVGDIRGLAPGLPVGDPCGLLPVPLPGDIIGDPVADGEAPTSEPVLIPVPLLVPVPPLVPDPVEFTVADGDGEPDAPEPVAPLRPPSSLQAPVKSARPINPAATI